MTNKPCALLGFDQKQNRWKGTIGALCVSCVDCGALLLAFATVGRSTITAEQFSDLSKIKLIFFCRFEWVHPTIGNAQDLSAANHG